MRMKWRIEEKRKVLLQKREERKREGDLLRLRMHLHRQLVQELESEEADLKRDMEGFAKATEAAKAIFAGLEVNGENPTSWFFSRGKAFGEKIRYASPRSAFGPVAIEMVAEMIFENPAILEKAPNVNKDVGMIDGRLDRFRGRVIGEFFLLVATRSDGSTIPLVIEEEPSEWYAPNPNSHAALQYLARRKREDTEAATRAAEVARQEEARVVGSTSMIDFKGSPAPDPSVVGDDSATSVLVEANKQKA